MNMSSVSLSDEISNLRYASCERTQTINSVMKLIKTRQFKSRVIGNEYVRLAESKHSNLIDRVRFAHESLTNSDYSTIQTTCEEPYWIIMNFEFPLNESIDVW